MRFKVKLWNDELIESELRSVVSAMGINRMPSMGEMSKFTGNYKLSNAISRYGGFHHWADKLNLNLKSSDSLHGWAYEDFVQSHLESLGYFVERMKTLYPYDMLVNDTVKVDVKGSKKHMGKAGNSGNFYSFNLAKNSATCDIFILCLIGAKDDIEKILVIPAASVQHNTQISVGEITSKYMKYVDRFDILDKYSEFFNGFKND